jgi:hypothetical protein
VVSDRSDFARVPDVLRVAAVVVGHTVYRAVTPLDRMLRGGGTVRASENRIEVRASDPTLPAVVAYHWHEALRCTPNCRVEREHSDIDRVGFIRVPAPHPSNFVVWNSYAR